MHTPTSPAPSGQADDPYLSVITTTDPRADKLPLLLRNLEKLASTSQESIEVVIVDDLLKWPSEQAALQDHALSNLPNLRIRIVWYREVRGQHCAILSGVQAATGEVLLTIDPDLHRCVGDIPGMLEQYRNGFLLVHGWRPQRPEIGPLRRAGSALANRLAKWITRVKVKDLGSPVTLVSASLLSVFEEVAPETVNPRLYLYLKYPDRLYQYPLTAAEPGESGVSHYSLPGLVVTFWQLMVQCIRTRRAMASR